MSRSNGTDACDWCGCSTHSNKKITYFSKSHKKFIAVRLCANCISKYEKEKNNGKTVTSSEV